MLELENGLLERPGHYATASGSWWYAVDWGSCITCYAIRAVVLFEYSISTQAVVAAVKHWGVDRIKCRLAPIPVLYHSQRTL